MLWQGFPTPSETLSRWTDVFYKSDVYWQHLTVGLGRMNICFHRLKLKEKKEIIHPPQESCWLILLKGVSAHDVSGSRPSSLEPAGRPAGAGVAAPKSLARMRTVPPPVYQSSNLVGTLQLIDSIGLRVEQPSSPSSRGNPWYFSRSLDHTHADIDPTMPNMCTGALYELQRLNNSSAIYDIYTVVPPLPSWTHCRSLPAGRGRRVQRGQID